MPVLAMTGSDSIIINTRTLADLADGNVGELTFPNNIATVKTGKNGNSIFGLNETGKQGVFKIRVVRGSSDDKFLLGLQSQQQENFAGFPLMIGEYIKKIGDGAGNPTSDTYIAQGGIFTKLTEAKTNTDGETEQSVSVYEIHFAAVARVIT